MFDHIWRRKSKVGFLKEHKSGGFRKEISAEAQWNKKTPAEVFTAAGSMRGGELWWTVLRLCPPRTKDQRWFIRIQPPTDDQSQVHAWGGFGIVIPTNSNLHEAFFCSEGCSELPWLSGRAQGVFMNSSARDKCFHLVHPSATLTAPSPPPPVDTGRCYAVDAS